VVKLAFDLCKAEADFRTYKVLYLAVSPDSERVKARYFEAKGCRAALRDLAGNILRMGRATKPVNRRALWRSFREGWRIARLMLLTAC
jgi:hypothetical protein